MQKLYPLSFHTQFKEKIWGGNKINSILGKNYAPLPNCGETWEISGVKGNVSIVKNGPLKGQSLQALLETYKENLVGHKVYEKYKNDFPLLVKFIDANDDLSIQVHPDDELALQRHACFGKSEMWYIMQADSGSKLNAGFSKQISKEIYLSHLQNNTLEQILNIEEVSEGDVYYMPAGRVHYIGKGILLAEIQQSSDITYRIYDFDRTDAHGHKRELHTDLALDAIDYQHYDSYKTLYLPVQNQPVTIVNSPFFVTTLLHYNIPVLRDYSHNDSFTIYVCVDGKAVIHFDDGQLSISKGEAILNPAIIKKIQITPNTHYKMLECILP